MTTAATTYPREETVLAALDAIMRPTGDRDSRAKLGSTAHNRWLARIDKIESVLAFVGGPAALARGRASVCVGAFERAAA